MDIFIEAIFFISFSVLLGLGVYALYISEVWKDEERKRSEDDG